MEPLHAVLTIVIVLSSLYYYFTRNFNYWKSRNVSGPKPVPFFGNLFESVLRRKHMAEIMRDLYQNYTKEKVVGIYRMTTPCLLLRDLNVIKQVMIKDFDCFEDRGIEISKEGLGKNLFNADGDTWRVLRNKFTPIFTSGKLKNMMYLITARGDKFIDYVDQICERNNEHEVHSLLQKYTLSTIAACAFGLDINTLGDKLGALNKLDKLIFELRYASELNMMFPGILKKLNIRVLPKEVTDFFYNLVETILTERNGVPSYANDFMDNLLELRRQKVIMGTKINQDSKQLSVEIDNTVMAAQAFVFYAAGYETSATTMTFMLYELAKNPDIQDKLIREIDEVLRNHNGEVTYDALKDMKYLHKVFDETLRMYPLAEPIQRNATVDYKIPETDIIIEKGTTVLVSAMGIHRDPLYYPNPDKFDPDRFEPELASSKHTCAYMPFGVGPRNCIGMRFAKLQSQVCITKFLSRFTVIPCEKTHVNMTFSKTRVVVSPEDGITLKILPRKV